jgi:hypothetical protein
MIQPKSWIDIIGIWNRPTTNEIRYTGPSDIHPPPIGIIINDGMVNKGNITCKAYFPETVSEARILFGYSSQSNRYYSAGLGGHYAGYAIQEFDPNFGWRGVKLAGNSENLRIKKEYHIEVQITGSKISLFVDDVRVLEHVLDKPLEGNQIGLLAVGKTDVVFKDYCFKSQKPDIFVVMQFSEPYDALYKDVIIPICEEVGLNVIRADDVFSEQGIILQDIVRSIIEAEIIIAEITPSNQNVFYELGYAHALKKPAILLAEKGKKLPFDIQGYRTLFYENSIKGKNEIIENLNKYLRAILNIREK